MKFCPEQCARIVNTNDNKLDGRLVRVVGIASQHGDITVFYIVEFKQAPYDVWRCMVIIDSCLEPYEETNN
jgi:hypothetical protein